MITFALKTGRIATVLLATACAGAASATIVLDDFTTGNYFKSLTSGTDLNVQSGTMVGLERSTYMEVQNNPLSQAYELSVGSGFTISNSGANVDGRLSLGYGYQADGFGGIMADDLNLDFTGSDRIRASFLSNDRTLNVRVTLFSGGSTLQSVNSRVVAGNQFTPFNEDFMLADFLGLASMTDVDQIQFEFDSLPSGDFAMGSITAVPEPASMIAIGVGLLGVIARRRNRKQ